MYMCVVCVYVSMLQSVHSCNHGHACQHMCTCADVADTPTYPLLIPCDNGAVSEACSVQA